MGFNAAMGRAGRAAAMAALVFAAGSGPVAWGQAGDINSVVVQAFDAQTGLPIDMHTLSSGLYNNSSVRLIVHAYDRMGNAVSCGGAPRFEQRSGAGGDLVTFAPQADGSVMMNAASSGFGSTEFIAHCGNFASQPIYTSVMAKGTNLGTAQAGLGLRRVPPSTSAGGGASTPPGSSAATAGKSASVAHKSHAGLITGLAVGGALAVGAIAYGLSGTSTSSGGSGSSCPTYSDYCPSGAGNGGGVRQSGCSCPGGTTTATCGSNNGNCGGLYPAGTVLCNC